MAVDNTTQLTNPELYINGDLVQIIPNSYSDIEPGEVKSRWISGGGTAGDVVHALDAETLLPTIKFELPNTPLNRRRIKEWKANSFTNVYNTVRAAWPGTREADSYRKVAVTNAVEREYSADGNLSVEMAGKKIV